MRKFLLLLAAIPSLAFAQSTGGGGAATTFANPTASVGTTAANGSASTAMRSDAAPAVDQTISPTWTGIHTFLPTATASPAAVNEQFVAGVSAGTTNANGALTSFVDSTGTGTGHSGGFEFFTHPVGSTGSAQNSSLGLLQLGFGATNTSQEVNFLPASTGSTLALTNNLFGASAKDQWSLTVHGTALLFWAYQVGSTPAGTYFVGPTGFASSMNSGPDVLIARRAAANISLGGADAAGPVAQTLSVQSVVAGTTNTAGTAWTFAGSQGTGTGLGGSLIFQTAPAGTTGSAQNTEQTVLTLDANSHAKFSSAAIPTVTSCGTGSPTVTTGSTDVAFEVTIGTSATACTIGFNISYAAAPFCVLTDKTALSRLTSYTIATNQIVLTMTSNSGDVVEGVCHGA